MWIFFSRTKSNTWVLARQRSKLNFQVKLVYSGLGNYSSLFFSPFHTMLNKKDKNGFFFSSRRKRIKCLAVYTTPECQGHHRKAPFSKRRPSTLKRKVDDFKFLRVEECFWKASFSWRISMDSRPNRRTKLCFRNISDGVSVDGASRLELIGCLFVFKCIDGLTWSLRGGNVLLLFVSKIYHLEIFI